MRILIITISLIILFFFQKNFIDKNTFNFSDAWSKVFVLTHIKPKKIFVFDFDLTLTLKQTHGLPIDNKFTVKELFGDYLEILKSLFKKIIKRGNCIFINTRACKSQVEKILDKANLIKYIEHIYGASCAEEIMYPKKYSYLWRNNKSLDSDSKWAIIKQHFLDKIRKKYDDARIYYFDDTKVNIIKAKEKYPNSFIAREGSISELICEIKQIMKLKH